MGREGNELVVVEVKTRHFLARLRPEHAVTWSKQRRIIATANHYLRELDCRPPPVRFDIVEVGHSADGALAIQHYENVPLFPKHFQP
jgi:putative endonuclease